MTSGGSGGGAATSRLLRRGGGGGGGGGSATVRARVGAEREAGHVPQRLRRLGEAGELQTVARPYAEHWGELQRHGMHARLGGGVVAQQHPRAAGRRVRRVDQGAEARGVLPEQEGTLRADLDGEARWGLQRSRE